jgi:hypothetical protein
MVYTFRSFWTILLFFTFLAVSAQKKGYEPGYIITLEGDTIYGQVKDRSPEPFQDLYARIRFIPNGKKGRTKYGSGDISGYGTGGKEYTSVRFREESSFFSFRYYSRSGDPWSFLRVIRRDGPITYYHKEYIHDDNFYLDFFPLIHRQGEKEMVRVTQGILGLKRKQLIAYFRDCDALVEALSGKEIKEPLDVYDFYLEVCMKAYKDTSNIETLKGRWAIDFNPNPDADPYVQEFRITSVSGNTFKGYFYGRPLKGTRLNRTQDELFFAFTTSDEFYEYYHTGALSNGELFGMTYCPDKEFVQPWKGVRK